MVKENVELRVLQSPNILVYCNSVEEQDLSLSNHSSSERESEETQLKLNITTIHQTITRLTDWRDETNGGVSVEETINLNSFNNSIIGASFGLFLVVLDWLADLSAAGLHFLNGDYQFSTLTLVIIFFGGFIVTFNLKCLIHRQGDEEFKDELLNICWILPHAMYIPSFLPFFSCGLRVYVAFKLRHENDKLEIQRLEELMKICVQHMTTDLLYERCYESFPQAIVQSVILLEKPFYKSYLDFLPLVCVLLTWCSLSLSPFQISKSVNKIKIKSQLIIAGFTNKGITILSFTLAISSSRKYFCGPCETWNPTLILATVLPFIVLTLLSDLPGVALFESERRLRDDTRTKRKLQFGMNLVASVTPMCALFAWIFTLHLETTYRSRNVVILVVFLLGWIISLGELCDNINYTWLCQFSTDIIILSYIGILSYFKEIEFQNINFQYVSPDITHVMGNQ